MLLGSRISIFSLPFTKRFLQIVAKLQAKFGDLYTIDNIMMAPTRNNCLTLNFPAKNKLFLKFQTDTHGGPGGYHQLVLYDITCFGFIAETYNPIVNGVAEAIVRAHNAMADGKVFYSEVALKDFGVNRSPKSYLANPQSERDYYGSNVDSTLQQIKFVNADNEVIGAFHWVASKRNV